MIKSTITRERLQEIAEDGFLKHGESKELARMALAAMDSEPVILYRERNPYNGLTTGWQELTENEFSFLKENAGENAEFVTLYRHAQPAPVVPDIGEIRVGRLPTMNQDEYPGLGDWWVQLRIGEDSDEVLARVYGATPQEAKNRAEALACRCAMLQAEPVTANKFPEYFDFDRFNDVVWLEAVASNPHMHSITTSTIAMVALELNKKLEAAGNSPVIPDGWQLVPVEPNGDMLAAAQDAYGKTDGDIASTLRAAMLAAAQPAPTIQVTDAMAYAFHHALTDGPLGDEDVEDIKTGLRASFTAVTIKQPKPVVPVEATIDNKPNSSYEWRKGWNACLAAMLAVAPPAPKSTVK